MTISFRTRLFVVAAMIVTTVITAVMLIGWNRVLAFEATRLEQRLCMEARRLATQPLRAESVPQVVNDLLSKLHLTAENQVMVSFTSRDSGEAGSSANWQPAFGSDGLTWRMSAFEPPTASSANESRSEPSRREAFMPPRGGACALASITMNERP